MWVEIIDQPFLEILFKYILQTAGGLEDEKNWYPDTLLSPVDKKKDLMFV